MLQIMPFRSFIHGRFSTLPFWLDRYLLFAPDLCHLPEQFFFQRPDSPPSQRQGQFLKYKNSTINENAWKVLNFFILNLVARLCCILDQGSQASNLLAGFGASLSLSDMNGTYRSTGESLQNPSHEPPDFVLASHFRTIVLCPYFQAEDWGYMHCGGSLAEP